MSLLSGFKEDPYMSYIYDDIITIINIIIIIIITIIMIINTTIIVINCYNA